MSRIGNMADSAAANELKEVEDIDVEYEPVEVQNNGAVNAQVEDMDEQNVEKEYMTGTSSSTSRTVKKCG